MNRPRDGCTIQVVGSKQKGALTMIALVTGASSGIGWQIACQLAARGWDLIVVARREDRLRRLKKYITSHFDSRVQIRVADLSHPDEVVALYKACRPYEIGLVVNNAGFGKVGPFVEIPLQEDLAMVRTNITAVHILTKLFVRSMSRGVILNVASMAAYQPAPLMATYAATKAYVLSLSRAVNYEMKQQHKAVRVIALCPGPVETEFNDVANAVFHLPSMPSERCVRMALEHLSDGRDTIIPGAVMNVLHVLSKLLPACWELPVQYVAQRCKLR